MAIRLLLLPPSTDTAIADKPDLLEEKGRILHLFVGYFVYRQPLQLSSRACIASMCWTDISFDSNCMKSGLLYCHHFEPLALGKMIQSSFETAVSLQSTPVGATRTYLWQDHSLMYKFIQLMANLDLYLFRNRQTFFIMIHAQSRRET